MQQYLDMLRHIRDHGVYKSDRTGTGTLSTFGRQLRFDLSNGQFPLVTTKKCHLKSIIHELLWFLKGSTNIAYLKENGVSIWDEWVKPDTAVYEPMSIQERLSSIPADSGRNEMVGGFFDKYLGNPELWAEKYTIRRSTNGERKEVLINKDGYDFLPGFLDKIGVDDKKLVAGELGPVYGAQWRSWPNPPTLQRIDLAKRISLWGEAAKLQYPYTDQQMELLANAIGTRPGRDEPWVWTRLIKLARNESSSLMEAVEKLMVVFDIPAEKYTEGGSIDQIQNVINTLRKNPDSRRIIVSAWNPTQLSQMALEPCHTLFQFYSAPMRQYEIVKDLEQRGLHAQFVDDLNAAFQPGAHFDWYSGNASPELQSWIENYLTSKRVPYRRLSCQLYQRSSDSVLGIPFNIASYALLTLMAAQVTNHAPGEFVWTSGDTHIYSNHLEQVDLQLSRTPYKLPTMKLNPAITDLFDFKFEDFELVGYESHPAIKAPVAV